VKIVSIKNFLALLSITVSSIASAQYKDHPLMSGPAGYKISDAPIIKDFGNISGGVLNRFVCEGDKACADTIPGFKGGVFVAEGKFTQIRYSNDKSPAGDLAILRSYENAFKQLGGRKLTARADSYGTHLFFVEKDGQRSWMVLDNGNSFVYLTFIEEKLAEQLVTAGQLSNALQKLGFATLYVNFDTNKSEIKPEMFAQLKEITMLLSKEPTLRISVEGHTDNVGALAANKTLSINRASSVMKYLISGGVDAKRLASTGFGSEAPVADNRTEEGKVKNRRVELVKIK
jgi:OmpA-OmpF porin, OOP family